MKLKLLLLLVAVSCVRVQSKDSDTLWTLTVPTNIQDARPFFSLDDKTILLASQNRALVVSVATGAIVANIDSVTIHKRFDDNTKYLGDFDRRPVLVDATTYRRLPIEFEPATKIIPTSFEVSPDCKSIYASSFYSQKAGYVKWNAETGKIVEEVDLGGQTGDTLGSIRYISAGQISIAKDGETVILSCHRQTYEFNGRKKGWYFHGVNDLFLRAYNVNTKALSFVTPYILSDEGSPLSATPDRQQLIAADYLNSVMVSISTSDGAILKIHPELPNKDFVFTDDVLYIASGGGVAGGLPVFDYNTGRRIALYKLTNYTGWSFADISHDRRYIVGSVGQSIVVFIADWSTSVTDDSQILATLRPNPASGRVELVLRRPFEDGKVEIYSSSGALIMELTSRQLTLNQPSTVSFEVSTLAEGSYLVRCKHDGLNETYQLLISR